MSTPMPRRDNPVMSAGRAVNQAFPGLQRGRRAGLAPVRRYRDTGTVPSGGGSVAVDTDWIQPDDVVTGTSPVRRSMQNSSPQQPADAFNGVTGATLSTSSPLLVDVTMPFGDGSLYVCFGAALVEFDAAKLAPIDPGTWPPGATDIEYESPQGTLLTATMSGLMSDDGGYVGEVSVGGPTTPYEVAGSTFQPSWHTPGDLAVTRFATRTLGTVGNTSWSVTFGPGDLSADDVYQVAFFAELHASATVPTDTAVTAEATVNCSYTYRPPRYRFIY